MSRVSPNRFWGLGKGHVCGFTCPGPAEPAPARPVLDSLLATRPALARGFPCPAGRYRRFAGPVNLSELLAKVDPLWGGTNITPAMKALLPAWE